MKKYELTTEVQTFFGLKLHRIRALISFGNVTVGELGGWVEKEENLSHEGDAWVSGNAEVSGNAWVSGDAEVSGDARVYGNAEVYGVGAIFWIGGIGSRNGTTTFFHCKDKQIRVTCGCFFGTIAEFAAKVQKTHTNNKHGKVYMASIELAKEYFELQSEEGVS